MRRLSAIALAALLLWPGIAIAKDDRSKVAAKHAAAVEYKVTRQRCTRLTKQIEHYAGIAKMAQNRGDDLWYVSTRAHMRRLEFERIDLCPEYKRPNPLIRFGKGTTELMKKAGRAALTYFTGGAM